MIDISRYYCTRRLHKIIHLFSITGTDDDREEGFCKILSIKLRLV